MGQQLNNTRYQIEVEIVTQTATMSLVPGSGGLPSSPIITYPLTFTKYFIDLYDDQPITIDYAVIDDKDISLKKGSRSLSLTAPETAKNRKIFSSISNNGSDTNNNYFNSTTLFNISNGFNPAAKAPCWVIEDTQLVFSGILQLVSINNNQSTGEIQYEFHIYDNNVAFYDALGDGFLTDDSYSYLYHEYTIENMMASWIADWTLGYYYPLIDYGNNWNMDSINVTFMAGNSGQLATYGILPTQILPAIYTKTIWNQLFYDTGYTYTSNFLNQPLFNNLIIPSSTPLLLDQYFLTQNSFHAASLGITTNLYNASYLYEYFTGQWTIPFIDTADSPNFDPSNSWDIANQYYTNNSGYNLGMQFGIFAFIFMPYQLTNSNLYFYIYRSQNPDGSENSGWSTGTGAQAAWIYSSGTGYIPQLEINTNNTNNLVQGPNTIRVVAEGITSPLSGSNGILWSVSCLSALFGGNNNTNFNQGNNGPIRPGESVRINISYLNIFGQGSISDIEYWPSYPGEQPPQGGIFYNQIYAPTTYNSLVSMNSVIPKQLKKKEFFMEIVNMFNLVIQPDPNNSTNLLIEPYNDFFNGKVIDWTQKVDTLTPYQTQVIAETQNRTTLFSYKEDGDYYNKYYKSLNQQVYGQYKYIINNDFLHGEKKIELKFCSTPMVGVSRSDGSISNLVIPMIEDNYQANSNQSGFIQMSYRMLLRGYTGSGYVTQSTYVNQGPTASNAGNYYANIQGLIHTPYSSVTQPNPPNTLSYGDTWTIYNPYYNTINALPEFMPFPAYPYAGHFDNPYAPTLDINYGTVSGLFYNGTILPANNLIYDYWQPMLDNYSNPNSRLVTVKIFLNSSDMAQFSFRNLIYLGNEYIQGRYIVNKITQYQPGVNQSVEVELLLYNTQNIPI